MWKSKKFILIVVAIVVAVAGSLAGVALAQTEASDESQTKTMFDRVTEILVSEGVNITSNQLKDAFTKARGDIRTEMMQERLQSLVEEDKITKEEADKYLEWWQAKPDVPASFEFRGLGSFGVMHGIRGMHGFGKLCVPVD